MTERIKNADLDRVCEILRETTRRDFYIQSAYGQPRLLEKEGPGARDVSPRMTKRNLHTWMWAYLEGFRLAFAPKNKRPGRQKFEHAIDWIEQHISDASFDEVESIARTMARSMDSDQIQDLFEKEMDADGFFNAEVEDGI